MTSAAGTGKRFLKFEEGTTIGSITDRVCSVLDQGHEFKMKPTDDSLKTWTIDTDASDFPSELKFRGMLGGLDQTEPNANFTVVIKPGSVFIEAAVEKIKTSHNEVDVRYSSAEFPDTPSSGEEAERKGIVLSANASGTYEGSLARGMFRDDQLAIDGEVEAEGPSLLNLSFEAKLDDGASSRDMTPAEIQEEAPAIDEALVEAVRVLELIDAA